MVGIIQEQHPARARLFMQWREMDWPLMVDSLDLLDVGVVPMTILLDEAGLVRAIQPGEDEFAPFLAAPVAAEKPTYSSQAQAPNLDKMRQAAQEGTAGPLQGYADALVMWGGAAGLDTAIAAYGDVLEVDPEDGQAHFRLGVAYRRRYDSASRRTGDFSRAIAEWGRGLEIDPNQYIWRRRIQQSGPRLSKPYPFYAWVAAARRQIASRGEVPVLLPVEPGGAELASPATEFASKSMPVGEPDADGRITRDDVGLIRAESRPWFRPASSRERPPVSTSTFARIQLGRRTGNTKPSTWCSRSRCRPMRSTTFATGWTAPVSTGVWISPSRSRRSAIKRTSAPHADTS